MKIRTMIFQAWICLAVSLIFPSISGAADIREAGKPDILVLTIDTLRADRISGLGYKRSTSPNLDELMHNGVIFTVARTVEPLTSPALCSMLTSIPPHRHGSSRNGLRMRPGLGSLPKELRYSGYRTAAFVGSWTLRDKLSGLAEHFDHYEEVLTRRRWFGLLRSEATAEDLNEAVVEWIRNERHGETGSGRPLFIWVHYVEPHAPYRFWPEYAERLGISGGNVKPQDRYDTEIASVDAAVGELLGNLKQDRLLRDPMFVFAADHGESLGEHNYWGHGRHLYEASLRIPMSITWTGHLEPGKITAPALLTDLAPTILRLVDLKPPQTFEGFDWRSVMLGGQQPPRDRVTHYQAHRGAVISQHESEVARRAGLLEIGMIDGYMKEIYRVANKTRTIFNLADDPAEVTSLSIPKEMPTEVILSWLAEVADGLDSFEDLPMEQIDEESAEHLRALGYVEETGR